MKESASISTLLTEILPEIEFMMADNGWAYCPVCKGINPEQERNFMSPQHKYLLERFKKVAHFGHKEGCKLASIKELIQEKPDCEKRPRCKWVTNND